VLPAGLQELRHEQPFDRSDVMSDFAIARKTQLLPVQRRPDCQRRAVLAPPGKLAGEHHQIVPKLVVINRSLSLSTSEHPLPETSVVMLEPQGTQSVKNVPRAGYGSENNPARCQLRSRDRHREG
jgi:hypothetical protein